MLLKPFSPPSSGEASVVGTVTPLVEEVDSDSADLMDVREWPFPRTPPGGELNPGPDQSPPGRQTRLWRLKMPSKVVESWRLRKIPWLRKMP